jgi:hypothetical protein
VWPKRFFKEKKMVTQVVVFGSADRAAMEDVVAQARKFSGSSSTDTPDGFFDVNDMKIPFSLLDRQAALFNSCEAIYVHGDSIYASEDYLVKAWETFDQSERESALICLIILISQGRLQLAQPINPGCNLPEFNLAGNEEVEAA